MRTDVIIIGGGVAGLTCARDLALLGYESIVVEKESFLGGHVAGFSCKATDQCRRCGACLLEDLLVTARADERIETLLQTTVVDADRVDDRFRVRLVQQPETASADRSEESDEFRGEGPTDADGPGREIEAEASAVILATGFSVFDARRKPLFGYGRVPGVVTALELDADLRQNGVAGFNRGSGVKLAAFIQCVGSRDVRIGRPYCSRVCCGYAMRTARVMKHCIPDFEATMFYMDMQSFERRFDERLREAADDVRLIRAMPAEVRSGSDNRPEIVYSGPDDTRTVESFDVVVLSVGISPREDMADLAGKLGAPFNSDGFLGPEGEGVSVDADGVFVAGTAQGPRSIEKSAGHAARAASETAAYLRRR